MSESSGDDTHHQHHLPHLTISQARKEVYTSYESLEPSSKTAKEGSRWCKTGLDSLTHELGASPPSDDSAVVPSHSRIDLDLGPLSIAFAILPIPSTQCLPCRMGDHRAAPEAARAELG